MNIQKVNFTNAEGQKLIGRLELPVNQHPHNFAIFAHCFTCNKNLSAVKNITRELTANGFGVLRFDFTGLGESEGDFENTNFSGNVEDLINASNYLKENHTAPTLLIGHSLGGAAVIFAASKIESVKAVATIGAPSNPKHVQHLIQNSVEEIKTTGKAHVNIGGRAFTIKKQFLDDIETKSLPDVAQNLRKALLVMHSPQDATVGIANAEEIYVAARHPKSFVTLDGADHLLMKKEDSIYVGSVIATWAKRYISLPKKETLSTSHQAVASLDADEGFTTQMTVENHTMLADEPTSYGGNDFGPSPYEFVSAGLSACTAMTVQMYTKRKGWDLQNIKVHTSHTKATKQIVENGENKEIKVDTFNREIKLEGNLDEKQIQRMLQIADKCPVHKTLHSDIEVVTKLV
ncbi:bifunctional alpha/beta hydrolase/OsmC family protein [Lacinutrix cladophorae]